MKKINVSIPTIIKNNDYNIKKDKKKILDIPSSVVIFQHNNLVEARYSLTLQEKRLLTYNLQKLLDEDHFNL